jgi:hypothetical protein
MGLSQVVQNAEPHKTRRRRLCLDGKSLVPDGEALPPVLRLLQLIHQRDGVVLH